MRIDAFVKTLLLIIAASLVSIAIRPLISPGSALAQSGEGYPLYIEPGTYMLRAPDGSQQVYGKVVVDLRNGKVWGFPTTTQDPYPSNPVSNTPPTSRPFLLARYAFRDTDK